MSERRKSGPVDRELSEKISRYFTEDCDVPVAIPTEAVPLDKMIEDLAWEKRLLNEENPDKSPTDPTRNEFLRKARFQKGLKQDQLRELAVLMGSTRIANFEQLVAWPTIKEATDIACVLGVSSEEIFPAYLHEFVESRYLERKRNLTAEFELNSLDQMPEDEIERAMEREKGVDIRRNETLEPVIKTFLRETVEDVLYSLSIKERRIIQLRFGIEDGRTRTLEEVGGEFGVTRDRIRQIEAKALRKLHHQSRAKYLKDYVEETNRDGYSAEALLNGATNALHKHDFTRAAYNLLIVENHILGNLASCDRGIFEEMSHYQAVYRWPENIVVEFVRWYAENNKMILNESFAASAIELFNQLKEVWRLQAQIPSEQ